MDRKQKLATIKDYEPIEHMKLFQSDWEEHMFLLNKIMESNMPKEVKDRVGIHKYKLQCMIDAARRNKVWV